MRQGKFERSEDKKVVVSTSRGEWFLFPDKSCEDIRSLPQGTPIEFDAVKPDGKNYWRMVSYKSRQARSNGHVSGPAGGGANTAEEIFVTGVVGRAMGSGQFGATDIDLLTKAATAAWRGRQTMARPNDAPSQMEDGRDEPPIDDEIPF